MQNVDLIINRNLLFDSKDHPIVRPSPLLGIVRKRFPNLLHGVCTRSQVRGNHPFQVAFGNTSSSFNWLETDSPTNWTSTPYPVGTESSAIAPARLRTGADSDGLPPTATSNTAHA